MARAKHLRALAALTAKGGGVTMKESTLGLPRYLGHPMPQLSQLTLQKPCRRAYALVHSEPVSAETTLNELPVRTE